MMRSPLRVAAAVGAAVAMLAAFPGAAGAIPISGTITSSDLVRPATIDPIGLPPSVCGPSGAPPFIQVGDFHYDAYAFTNGSGAPQCVTVTVSSATGQGVRVTAYQAGVDYVGNPPNFLGTSGVCLTAGSFGFTAPPGGFTVVVEECFPNAGSTYTADVSGTGIEGGAPVAAILRGAPTVTVGASGVTVRWHTASQVGVLGFKVYREMNGVRTRLNSRLIPAGGAAGRAYSFRDRRAPAARRFRYWIQAVNADGLRTWLAPTASTRRELARSVA
jgi:hypothetical protein